LKTLASGNLLVTGPYALNGVPLKRINPAYAIATSTKVALDGVTANID
jgi:large subunit ribosomal protein L6e